MPSVVWSREIAEVYDTTSSARFRADDLGPTVDTLSELARGGPVLELAIGTGRVALPLIERGITVSGIELSPYMVEQLRKKRGADAIDVVLGDMATAKANGKFALVYLVYNALMNLTTQDEQVQVFLNAADHLQPGGYFVTEVVVPNLRNVPSGELGSVFALEPDHVGVETFDDVETQVTWSHHWFEIDGRVLRHSAPYRYVWPAETDLMARLAGMRLRHRWEDWKKTPFRPDSEQQVAVYERLA